MGFWKELKERAALPQKPTVKMQGGVSFKDRQVSIPTAFNVGIESFIKANPIEDLFLIVLRLYTRCFNLN